MRGVAVVPVVAITLILIAFMFSFYVFSQDRAMADSMAKEGEIKKGVLEMDKKLGMIPGIALDALNTNKNNFQNDDTVEQIMESRIKEDLGINTDVTITGGNWESTNIRVFIPYYEVQVGGTRVSVSNLKLDYKLEAPRPQELYRVYATYDSNDVCRHVKDSYTSGGCCMWGPPPQGGGPAPCLAYQCYYSRWVAISSYESYEESSYGLGRAQWSMEPLSSTSCYDTKCGGGCGCRIGTIVYRVRISDPGNVFTNFGLKNRNTGGYIFSCIDG